MTDTMHLSSYLEAVGRDLDAAARREVARRRRRRPIRIAALVAAGVVLAAGTALAASSLLGGAAPAPMQSALDAFYPDNADGGLAPVEGDAQVVARFGEDVLYRSPARDGTSVCTAITAIGEHGATEVPGSGCTADTGDRYWPIGLHTLGFHDRALIVGQVRAPAGRSLSLVRPGAGAERVPLGIDGFFLWELPLGTAGSLVLRDAAGAELSTMHLPALQPLRGSPSVP